MKTPIEQLIEHMEYVKDYSAFARDCITKAKSLLPEERKVIEDVWNDSREGKHKIETGADFEYTDFEQYYQTKFNKDGKE
jgi:hypothetical protein